MASNDIIANLVVQGGAEFARQMSDGAEATQKLSTKIEQQIDDREKLNKTVQESRTVLQQYIASQNEQSKGLSVLKQRLEDAQERYKHTAEDVKKLQKEIDSIAPGKQQAELIKELNAANKALKEEENIVNSLKSSIKAYGGENIRASKIIRDLRNEMRLLALDGKENTDEYRELTRQLGEAQRVIDNVATSTRSARSATQGLDEAIRGVQLGVSVFGAMQGATALFGKESESVGRALVKLNAVIAVSNSLQQIQSELTRSDNILKVAGARANQLYALAVGQGTTAMKLFRVALIATGVGAFAVALGALVNNFDKINEYLFGVNGKLKRFGDWVINLAEKIPLLGNAVKNWREENERNNRIMEFNRAIAIQEAHGIDSRATKIAKLREEQKQYNKTQVEYWEKQKEINDLEESYLETAKEKTKEIKEQAKEMRAMVGSLAFYQSELSKANEIMQKSIPDSDEYREASKEVIRLTKLVNELQDRIASDTTEIPLPDVEDFAKRIEEVFNFDLPDRASLIEAEDIVSEDALERYFAIMDAIDERRQLSFQEQMQRLTDYYNAEIENAEKIGLDSTAIQQSFLEAQKEMRISQSEDIFSQVGAFASQAFDVFRSFNQAQEQVLNERLKAGEISEQEYQEEITRLKERQAKQDKTKAIFDATINAALAITAVLKQGLAGIPLIPIVAALSAAQIAAIVATPIPKFYDGVIDLKRGKYPKGRDTIPAMLHEGESVMTAKETKKYKPALEAMRKGTFDKIFMPIGSMGVDSRGQVINLATSEKYLSKLVDGNRELLSRSDRQITELKKLRRNKQSYYV